jgi:hypothetical protein
MSVLNNMSNSTVVGERDEPESYYVILALLGTLAVLFNGVLLIVLWRNKTPEFRVGTSYVIGNLALADCLTGKTTTSQRAALAGRQVRFLPELGLINENSHSRFPFLNPPTFSSPNPDILCSQSGTIMKNLELTC